MANKKDGQPAKGASAKKVAPKKDAQASGAGKPSKEEIRKHLEEALRRTHAAQNEQHGEFGNEKGGKGSKQQVPKGRMFRHQGRG
jgi:hypothetical protein